jgi:hypothetical protein
MGTTLVDRAIDKCRASQSRLDASCRLLAHSDRLLNRAWWIAGASDVDGDGSHGATGVIYIECRQRSREPPMYLVSFGGHKDRVGTFFIGQAIGLDPLTALLRKLGVPSPAMRTALQVLMAEQHHKIPDVTLTPARIRELGL